MRTEERRARAVVIVTLVREMAELVDKQHEHHRRWEGEQALYADSEDRWKDNLARLPDLIRGQSFAAGSVLVTTLDSEWSIMQSHLRELRLWHMLRNRVQERLRDRGRKLCALVSDRCGVYVDGRLWEIYEDPDDEGVMILLEIPTLNDVLRQMS